jgi:hydroxyethylthiazole kinase-like uncharacterized protein yjeF
MSGPTQISLERLGETPLPGFGGAVDKDQRGRVLVVGGGKLAPGAVVLAGVAALRAGCGKLQLAATDQDARVLAYAVPEAGLVRAPARRRGGFKRSAIPRLAEAAKRADALVIGPGMSDPVRDGRLAAELVRHLPPSAGAVVDAAALTGLDMSAPGLRAARGRLVLTPHAGEMAAVTGRDREEIEADPLGAARALAAHAEAVVVMKGGDTFIVTPDGRAWRHADGEVGLATSGSGDVLAGLIGGFLARGASPLAAALWGVCVHGGAGAQLARTVGPLGFLAREILDVAPGVLAEASPRP